VEHRGEIRGNMDLQKKADQIRKDVIRVAVKNKAGHIAPSLSCVDILTALYYDVMKPEDHFILSKSHGCYGLYSILADKGLIPKEDWENFNLSGCSERMVDKNGKPIIEAGCGSLGHGLPIAVGITWGLKLQGKQGRVFCLMGDGETQEGSTWEAIQFAHHHELSNLTIIVDRNRLQAMDSVYNIMDHSFLCLSHFCLFNGHDFKDIKEGFALNKRHQPNCLSFNTIKGKGLKCAENIPAFHFRLPSDEELKLQ